MEEDEENEETRDKKSEMESAHFGGEVNPLRSSETTAAWHKNEENKN